MDFTRDIYNELVRWSENTKGLILKGPRQVGKTYILDKLAKEKFKNSLYINLGNINTHQWFEENCTKVFNDSDWSAIFERYADYVQQIFSNTEDTLVIIDEIQSSARVFNGIRGMVRGGKFKVVATGSYLGIMDLENYFSENKQAFFYPMGDVELLELHPMTYLEVINACNKYGISDMQEIYQYYIQYGGFPEVVANWIGTRQPIDCMKTLENIYNLLIAESQKYFYGPFPETVWTKTLIGVALQLETNKDILGDYIEGIPYKFRRSNGVDIGRDETVDSLRWLLSCNLLFMGDVSNNLKTPKKSVKHRFFFADQGLFFLILNKAVNLEFPSIDRNNITGILAENFVALNIREFTTVVSYSRNNPTEEIDFIAHQGKELTGIEVKFKNGPVKSSEYALGRGEISRIIKIQGEHEESSENITVLPLSDAHKLGMLLGHEFGKTKYTQTYLDIF